jgi:hypothetical protein
MHSGLRRTLFIVFFLAFFVVGALLVIKTQGLVIDWKTLKFEKTGGVYIRALPGDAEILIDGKPYRKPISLFNRGTLIKDLSPKTYEIEVAREGRKAWKKTLAVESGLVAAATNIRLFEDHPKTESVSARFVDDFWMTREGPVESSGGKLYLGAVELAGSRVLEANADQANIITEDANGARYLIDLGRPGNPVNISNFFAAHRAGSGGASSKLGRVMLHPFAGNTLIAETSSSLYLLDTRKQTVERILQNPSSTPGALVKSSNEIFWVRDGNTLGYNLLLGTAFSFPVPVRAEKAYATKAGNTLLLIDRDMRLHAFDRLVGTSTVVAEHVKNVVFSPDEEKALVVGQNNRVSIYYLVEDTGDVKVEKGKLRTVPLAAAFRNAADFTPEWFPDFYGYLWVKNNATVYAVEADVRLPVNVDRLGDNIKKAAFFDGRFYLLDAKGAFTATKFAF